MAFTRTKIRTMRKHSGPGRPRLTKAELRRPLTVTLTPERRERLEEYARRAGHRSLSNAVEALIDQIQNDKSPST